MYSKENPLIIGSGFNISDICNVKFFEFRGYLFERCKYKDGSGGTIIYWRTTVADTVISVFQARRSQMYFVSFGERPRFTDLLLTEHDTGWSLYTSNTSYSKNKNMSMFKKSDDIQIALGSFFDEIFSRSVLLRLQNVQRIINEYVEKLERFEHLIEIKDVLE